MQTQVTAPSDFCDRMDLTEPEGQPAGHRESPANSSKVTLAPIPHAALAVVKATRGEIDVLGGRLRPK
jgi:hypothetical protein